MALAGGAAIDAGNIRKTLGKLDPANAATCENLRKSAAVKAASIEQFKALVAHAAA